MARRSKPWWWAERNCWATIIGGRRRFVAAGDATDEQVLEAFYALRAALKTDPQGTRTPTAAVLCDAFLEHAYRDLKPSTYETYRRHLNGFIAHVGKAILADDIRPYHVGEWLENKAWSSSTRHAAITSVKSAFAWGRRQGYLTTNPVADMAKPTPKSRTAVMTDAQAAKVLEAAGDDAFKDWLTALRETGMRPSEAMVLEAGMVDWTRAVVVMASKTSRRTQRPRIIHLTPAMLDLCRRLAQVHPTGPLLRNARGRPWTRNSTAQRFLRIRRKLGYGPEATSESYRHGFATDALEKGIPAATVAELLGHRSVAMLMKSYSHLCDRREHLEDALRRVRPSPT